MKNLKSIFSLIAMVLIFLIACDEEQTNPVTENGAATISGIAYVNLSELNDTNVITDWNYEFVPSGTVLYAMINSEDLVLVPSSTATYADIFITTIVGGNGAYSFEIPANSKNFTVAITGNDFQTNFVDAGADTITSPKIFSLEAVEVGNIHNGAIRIENLYYE